MVSHSSNLTFGMWNVCLCVFCQVHTVLNDLQTNRIVKGYLLEENIKAVHNTYRKIEEESILLVVKQWKVYVKCMCWLINVTWRHFTFIFIKSELGIHVLHENSSLNIVTTDLRCPRETKYVTHQRIMVANFMLSNSHL